MSSRITPAAYEQAGITLHLQYQARTSPGVVRFEISKGQSLTNNLMRIVSYFHPAQLFQRSRDGGARRSRTDDILLAKQALYQLSYGPISQRS